MPRPDGRVTVNSVRIPIVSHFGRPHQSDRKPMMGLPIIAAIPTSVMTKPASIALRLCPWIISALAQNVNPHVPQKAAKPVSPSKPPVATYTKAAELLGLKPDQ